MFTPLVQPNPNASSSSSSTAPRTRIGSVDAPEYTRIHSSPPKTLFLWRILHRIYPNFQALCFMNDPIFSKTEFIYCTVASWTAIEKSTRDLQKDPQIHKHKSCWFSTSLATHRRWSGLQSTQHVPWCWVPQLIVFMRHFPTVEKMVSLRLRILPLLLTQPTKKFLSPNCCYGTHMQACRPRTSWRWSSEDHAQEITTVRTTAKPWDVAAAAAAAAVPTHHPEDFCARLDPKHKLFSKSKEQWTRMQFFILFFSSYSPAWTVCTCFRHRRSPSCYGVQSLVSRSKQGGRRLFGANSTATHATPKSSGKEEVLLSSFSAHQWENQPPKKTKNKRKTCKIVEFCTPIQSKNICVKWGTTSVVLVSGFAHTRRFLVSIFHIYKSG